MWNQLVFSGGDAGGTLVISLLIYISHNIDIPRAAISRAADQRKLQMRLRQKPASRGSASAGTQINQRLFCCLLMNTNLHRARGLLARRLSNEDLTEIERAFHAKHRALSIR